MVYLKDRFAKFTVLFLVLALLTACAKEGDKESVDEEEFVPGTLPPGATEFKEIIEPFVSRFLPQGDTEYDQTLFSFDPDAIEDAVQEIIESNNDVIITLNTVDNGPGQSEYSIVANNDSVYRISLEDGEIKHLNHFVTRVCEILPSQYIYERGATEYVVLDEERVFVVTVQGENTRDEDCSDPDKVKLYYSLALNYEFDAEELDPTVTNDLPIVDEDYARAQLVTGWVDDDTGTQKELGYGYLGYNIREERMRFFDSDRAVVWSQNRNIETFLVAELANGDYSHEYLFELTPLEEHHYLLQIGRDVFVFDATQELFGRPFNDLNDVFGDRVLQIGLTTEVVGSQQYEIIKPVSYVSDLDTILFIEDHKIFRLAYLENYVDLPTYPDITVERDAFSSVGKKESGSFHPFSQFDLGDCDDADDVAACESANEPNPILNPTPGWQFITDCEASLGCSLTKPDVDVCLFEDELTGGPDEVLCHSGEYTHLDEMDDDENDAEFRGFMQYGDTYLRSASFILDEDSVLITARMTEREVFLRFNYETGLSEPKSVRETVIFGEDIRYYGMDAYLNNNNLYMTALRSNGQERFNECYKNYQRVTCELGELEEPGNNSSCTGADLANGICYNSFKEYKPYALFCLESELIAGTCQDDNFSDLSVLSANENGRWVEIQELGATQSSSTIDMWLLLSEANELEDEGVMLDAELFDTSIANGNLSFEEFNHPGIERVESSLKSSYLSTNDLMRLDVISDDSLQTGGDGLINAKSVVSTFFVENPKNNEDLGAVKVSKVNTMEIARPTTH